MSEGTKVKKASAVMSHPKYIDMVTEAIKALKERNGSSRQAICKNILAAHPELSSEKANNYVRSALKKGLEKGVLKRPKGSAATGATGRFKLGDVPSGTKAKKSATTKKPAKPKKSGKKKTSTTKAGKKPSSKKSAAKTSAKSPGKKTTKAKKTTSKTKAKSATKAKPKNKKVAKKPAAKKSTPKKTLKSAKK